MEFVEIVAESSPTPGGRLYPRLVEEVNLLVLESPDRTVTDHLVTVTNTVFDLDASRRVMFVEFLIPKNKWKKVNRIRWPDQERVTRADLVFSESTVASPEYDVRTHMSISNADIVRVILGTKWDNQAVEYIELSQNALAVVEEERLAGFVVNLNSGQ